MRNPIAKSIQRSFLKSADPYALPDYKQVATQAHNEMISGGLDDVAKAVLAMGTLGLGARAVGGLGTMFGRPQPHLVSGTTPALLEVPHPVYETPQDENNAKKKKILGAAGTSIKTAEDTLNPIGHSLGMYADPQTGSGGSFLAGHGADPHSVLGKLQMPWYAPAVAIGGIGAGAGGYKFMDWLLNKKRKADLKSELDSAHHDFQNAMIDQYDPQQVKMLKASAVDNVAVDLDRLADLILGPEKRADGEAPLAPSMNTSDRMLDRFAPLVPSTQTAKSVGGAGLGIYAALAGLTALGSGYLSHQYFSKTDPSKTLADAIKNREAQRWSTRPPEIFAVPVPARRQGTHLIAKHQVQAEGI